MHLFFSLCVVALISNSCEADYSTTKDDDYVTSTPDYDYNATFDYYFVTVEYPPDQDQDGDQDGDQDPKGLSPESSHLTTSVLLMGLAAGHMI